MCYQQITLAGLCAALFVAPIFAASPSGFGETTIATGLQSPTSMAFAPDGRLFVNEQAGRVRIIRNGSLLATPFLTVNARSDGERGLLGIAFDPNFAVNRWVYIYYTANSTGQNRLSRFRASSTNPDVVEAGSEQYLIQGLGFSAANHNGGALHFGTDNHLYVAIGEHGNPSWAQDLSRLAGKILRLNPANYPNIIPSDNPFVGQSGARGEIWAYGLRNPFTFAVDPISGRMHINDVGQRSWEEINLGVRGANYGWPTCEGSCSTSGMTNPIYQYPSSCAITGGAFYRSSQFPAEYNGDYFFADYCSNFVKRLRPNNTVSNWGTAFGAPVDLRVGPDGMLYVLEYNGSVKSIRYLGTGANRPPVASPTANPTSGSTPLTVSFNGSGSSDPDGDPLAYSWDFGDSSASTQVSPSHTYTTAGTYTARLTVSDGRGGTNSATISISAGNSSPTGTITAPAQGTTYQAGETITAIGTGTDPQDGTLAASAFSWTVVFHHDAHTHPFLGPTTGTRTITFQIPTTGETSTNVWYRIRLTVTDSGGLSNTTTRDITPRVGTLRLRTMPTGLGVLVDGAPQMTPYTFSSVVGMRREIGVTTPQTVNGRTYVFDTWSDGGADRHFINTPSGNTTYTANFHEVTADTTPPAISSVNATGVTSSDATIAWTTNEAADTQVEYGTTTSYGSLTSIQTNLVTSHSQPLSGLQPSTLYHYRVRSKDGSGNLAISGDFTFMTSTAGIGSGVSLIRENCTGYSNCYTSLAGWQAAFGGINFGGCAAGDLVCANKTAVAQIDGLWANSDTRSLRIDGWRTGPNNYIHIYTTPQARHNGKWKSNAYRLVSADPSIAPLDLKESYIRIDGLQIYADLVTNPRAPNYGVYIYNLADATTTADIRISNSIIRGTASAPNGIGIFIENVASPAVFKIWNNIVYDFPTVGIRDSSFNSGGVSGYLYLYNNLVYNTGVGFYPRGTPSGRPAAIYNNIAAGNTNDYSPYASFSSAANNISADATSPNAAFRNRTVIFVNAAARDFHLGTSDTAARNQGIDLSMDSNLPFTIDIDGQTRLNPWDIGPDESP